jgi:hypothetical protein
MYDLSAYSQWVIRRFTALFGKGLVYRASTHLHHRHVPEERHQSGEGIGREEHATFGDDAENLRRDEEKW